MKRLRAILGWALRLGLVAVCLAYVLRGVDWETTAAAVRTYSWPKIGLTLAYAFVGYAVLGLRLRLLSRGELRLGKGIQACLVGLGVNNVLPAKLGELAKVLYLRRAQAWPMGTSLALVFWERFLDANLVLLVALAAVAQLGLQIAFWPLLAAVLGLWAGVLALRVWPGLGARVVGWLPLRGVARVVEELRVQISTGLAARVFAAAALCSLGLWVVYAGAAWLTLVWVANLPIGPQEVLAVFALTALGMSVPSSPGGLGVFEAAVVVGLGWFGVSKSEALPIAIVYHLLHLVPSTALGLTFLTLADFGLGDLWAERHRILEEHPARKTPDGGDPVG